MSLDPLRDHPTQSKRSVPESSTKVTLFLSSCRWDVKGDTAPWQGPTAVPSQDCSELLMVSLERVKKGL